MENTNLEKSNSNKIKKIKLNFSDGKYGTGRRKKSIAKVWVKKGVNHFIEIGPGKVLSGLIKRINKDVKINSINNESDIKDLKI